jgi:hypothetical protein
LARVEGRNVGLALKKHRKEARDYVKEPLHWKKFSDGMEG